MPLSIPSLINQDIRPIQANFGRHNGFQKSKKDGFLR